MIITRQTLENFNACELLLEAFCRDHPHGLDISALWGTKEDAQNFWSVIFASGWKGQVGWAISEGLLPSRIRANLNNADLSCADLSNADLYRANLNNADLRWADLRYANLSWANLSWADLGGAKWNEYTAWPAGFSPPGDG